MNISHSYIHVAGHRRMVDASAKNAHVQHIQSLVDVSSCVEKGIDSLGKIEFDYLTLDGMPRKLCEDSQFNVFGLLHKVNLGEWTTAHKNLLNGHNAMRIQGKLC